MDRLLHVSQYVHVQHLDRGVTGLHDVKTPPHHIRDPLPRCADFVMPLQVETKQADNRFERDAPWGGRARAMRCATFAIL